MLGVLRVEWNKDNNVKQMWKQMKLVMVNSAKEVCESRKIGKNPKNVWQNNVKVTFEKKEVVLKVVLGARDEIAKERHREPYKK